MYKKNIMQICIPVLFFFIVSIISLYNASEMINMDNLVVKQIIWYLLGIVLILFIKKIGNKIIIDNIFIFYIIFNILLLLLLIFGKPVNNSKCWFEIPGIGTFQPSEFMKIILILIIAKTCSENKNKFNFKNEISLLTKIFMLIIIPSLLTFLQPDTGVVIIYLIVTLIQLFIYGLRKEWFIFIFLSIAFILSLIFFIYYINQDMFTNIFGTSFFLRIDRLLDWSNKSGYQLENSLISIGGAGIFGYEFDNPLYFPESQTDFIFSIYSSSFGFFGSLILIIIILIFDISLIKIAFNVKENLNKYIICGFLGMIFYQQIQNIGMTIGFMPITGITLPFISYGGSSLLSYMLMIGIILNIIKKEHKALN